MDGRFGRTRCGDGEEPYDVCQRGMPRGGCHIGTDRGIATCIQGERDRYSIQYG